MSVLNNLTKLVQKSPLCVHKFYVVIFVHFRLSFRLMHFSAAVLKLNTAFISTSESGILVFMIHLWEICFAKRKSGGSS